MAAHVRLMGPSWKLAVSAASLLALAGSFAGSESQTPVADEQAAPPTKPAAPPLAPQQIAHVNAEGDLFLGDAKPDGRRFTLSAARYADVKSQGRMPRSAAKRADDEPFSDPTMPRWLRLSPPTAEETALRDIREVGLAPIKTKKELEKQFTRVQAQYRGAGDAFTDDLVADRPELAGLPFRTGAGWRLDEKRVASLSWTSQTIRILIEKEQKPAPPDDAKEAPAKALPPPSLTPFFGGFRWYDVEALRTERHPQQKLDALTITVDDTAASAVLPGLMQILAVQAPQYRLEIVAQLQSQFLGDEVAVSALVRLALFDADADVRAAAVKALQHEPAGKYGPRLVAGLRYPLPIVAERAARAIVALDRTELLPKLADLLDEPDPATPVESTEGKKKSFTVREVVKVNHHRNCLLCHAPAEASDFEALAGVLARVPAPDAKLPPLTSRLYYATGAGDAVVRANETFLRPDFSAMQKVADQDVWPEMQRFDYLVQTRTIDAAEAERMRRLADAAETPPPNRRAILYALTRLTSTYPGTKSDDWRPEIRRRLEAEKKSGR